MRFEYKLNEGKLQPVGKGEGNVVIYADPSPEEKELILATLPIKKHTLLSMLDPDELSRAEFEPDCNIIIWKRVAVDPTNRSFAVTSVGLVLEPDRLTIIEREQSRLPHDSHRTSPLTLRELLLRGMQTSVIEFIQRIRTIRQTSKDIQDKLARTLDSRHLLLQMLDLSEGLAFTVDAIDANHTVLKRLAEGAKQLGMSDKEIDLLDEVMIDNAQVSRQGHIYVSIFAGLVDARSSLVSNNMNILLKNLTIVNVIFLPLGVLAGIGGMSEFSVMLQQINVPLGTGYLWFMAGMVFLGIAIGWLLRWWVTRLMTKHNNEPPPADEA